MRKAILFLFTSILFLSGCNNEVTSNQPKLIEFGEDERNALEILISCGIKQFVIPIGS